MNEQLFESYLQSNDMPDPDLLIRTSGEQRLSNFLLWQSAYTEFLFTSTLWPDFKREHLEQAVYEYQRRERRYGGSGN
jgi:undecaprenyl diphosphate synthase